MKFPRQKGGGDAGVTLTDSMEIQMNRHTPYIGDGPIKSTIRLIE